MSVRDVSVLFSEPKIPQSRHQHPDAACTRVSVLFSEPKIPQLAVYCVTLVMLYGFSALQRAENSSILWRGGGQWLDFRFSALQRAENSSIELS